MGTHPIFESDFDCLTEMGESSDISLKVMRISRPMFQPEAPIHAEEDDLIYSTGSTNYSGLSNSLLIPNSVGDFYLGEPANFMVTVQNLCVSKDEMSNVRVLIQTESRNVPRVNVHDSSRDSNLEYSEFETIYFKIDCRYPEEISMLCEVTYDSINEKNLNFKR